MVFQLKDSLIYLVNTNFLLTLKVVLDEYVIIKFLVDFKDLKIVFLIK